MGKDIRRKMTNKLLKNILEIHEIVSDIEKFVNIKMNIESLEKNGNYKKVVKDTDMLINVLNAFSKRIK